MHIAKPLGLLLGAMALHAGDLAGNSRLPRYVVPILIMLVPLLDTGIVSVSRLATGTPVSRRGLDHSHHRLLAGPDRSAGRRDRLGANAVRRALRWCSPGSRILFAGDSAGDHFGVRRSVCS
jgi:hypothetical protein